MVFSYRPSGGDLWIDGKPVQRAVHPGYFLQGHRGGSGQTCPNLLPPAPVGEAYQTIVTLLPPPSGEIAGFSVPVIRMLQPAGV